MKIPSVWLCALVCLALAHGGAQAIHAGGALPDSRSGGPPPTVVAPVVQRGVITAIRPDVRKMGTQIEIGGRWLLVLTGRTGVRRDGLLVGADALQVGQTIGFTMATTTPGETALGVVHAP